MTIETDTPNADASLHVVFYSKPVQNEFQTKAEGRPIYSDVDWVKIIVPGDKNNIIDTYAREDHKLRFPVQWARYQNQKQGVAETGTPLTAWTLISAAKAEELRGLNFKTVESIAHASDGQLQSLGMAAGMAPHEFRARAQRYLQAAKDESFSNEQAEAANRLAAENAEMKAQMEEMKQMIAQLAQNQKKTPGRKPGNQGGEELESDGQEHAA
jgi:hypothetical protein